MAFETGISIYFRSNTIHIRKKTLYDLQRPEYIKLLVDESGKFAAIQSSEKSSYAFKLHYEVSEKQLAEPCYLRSKRLVKYISHVAGIRDLEQSYRFNGMLHNDGQTVIVDLSQYTVINPEEEETADGGEMLCE